MKYDKLLAVSSFSLGFHFAKRAVTRRTVSTIFHLQLHVKGIEFACPRQFKGRTCNFNEPEAS